MDFLLPALCIPHDACDSPYRAEYLYITHDGGRTWASYPTPAKIGTLFFLIPSTGWYVGKQDPNPGMLPEVYQTRDGGEHWTPLQAQNPPPLGSEL